MKTISSIGISGPAGGGHIRAASLPVIGNEVFDGRFRAIRQMTGSVQEQAVSSRISA